MVTGVGIFVERLYHDDDLVKSPALTEKNPGPSHWINYRQQRPNTKKTAGL